MTIVAANWVGENTSTVGTGPLALSGAISTFCPFSVLPDRSEVYYTLQEGFNRETGIGVVSNGTLTRKVQATLVAGVYAETDIPISLSGNGQVFAVINADFMTRIYNFSLDVADSVSAAAASAQASADSVAAAAQSAQEAAQSASLANDYETAASQSAYDASASAQSASDSKIAADASKTAAANSASDAANSQADALASKNAAASSQADALASKNAAKTSETNSKNSETAAAQSATNSSNSADAALDSENAAKTSETNSKTSETNAKNSEINAAASQADAANSAAAASADADRAEEAANTIDTSLFMRKDNNLQDVADKAAAWLNVRPIGATPLAADAVNDYDAPTLRQVRNLIENGTTGPMMNGVMNYHIGEAVQWETRAYYPPNCLPRDGQLVNRADWPELWAWAQKTTLISDAAWLADVTKRGSYSTGNGSTTFRLPDWNGVQSGSIPANFFRGGVGAADMTIKQNAAPNITGRTGLVLTSQATASTGSLVDNWSNYWSVAQPGGTSSNIYRENNIGIDASRSSSSYGRNSTTEVYPNHVSGVWLVRASGGFTAANTSWSVINADATAPTNGMTVNGGKVRSVYKVGTAEYASADLQASVATSRTGVRTVGAEVVVNDATSGTATSKTIKLGTVDGLTGGAISSQIVVSSPGITPALDVPASSADSAGTNALYRVSNSGSSMIGYMATVTGQYFSFTEALNYTNGTTQYWEKRSSGQTNSPLGMLAVQGSDVRIKTDFRLPKSGAWARVEAIGICEFKYNGSDIPQRGFLAQQMGDIDSMYVFTAGKAENESGEEFDILNVNDRAVMADMITVIQELQQKVTALEALEAEIKALKGD